MDRCHYVNGSVSGCSDRACPIEQHGSFAAMRQALKEDPEQDLYSPREAARIPRE